MGALFARRWWIYPIPKTWKLATAPLLWWSSLVRCWLLLKDCSTKVSCGPMQSGTPSVCGVLTASPCRHSSASGRQRVQLGRQQGGVNLDRYGHSDQPGRPRVAAKKRSDVFELEGDCLSSVFLKCLRLLNGVRFFASGRVSKLPPPGADSRRRGAQSDRPSHRHQRRPARHSSKSDGICLSNVQASYNRSEPLLPGGFCRSSRKWEERSMTQS